MDTTQVVSDVLNVILDYLVIGSDSGRITILEYNTTLNRFERVHLETFGKSGCRRVVPGQYVATDPKGRAIMIGE
jgi:splicing factor 3B subunit 3